MKKLIMPLIKHPLQSQSGSVSIEFAFIGMLLIVLTLGTFELARIAYVRHTLLGATGLATRMVGMGASDAAIEAAMRARFGSNEQSAVTISFAPQIAGGLSYRRIDAEFALPLIIPNLGLFPRNTFTVRAVQLIPTV